jgi:Zn-dependent peptidase ImmA (M78 family)
MMVDVEKARERAAELLRAHDVQQPPVDVRSIAEREGIRVMFEELEDSISGFVVRRGVDTSIGVNKEHHSNRQRFTLAHELGHYRLHIQPRNNPTAVYVDAEQTLVHFRAEIPDAPPNADEVEANSFAAALLMPEDFVRRDLHGTSVNAHDDSAIRHLAKRYGVSVQALTIRLVELGLIRNVAGI